MRFRSLKRSFLDVRAYIEDRLGGVFGKARSGWDALVNGMPYTGSQRRPLRDGPTGSPDPTEAAFDQILLEAGRRVGEAKHELVIRIVRARCLGRTVERLETEMVEWGQFAEQDEHAGKTQLAADERRFQQNRAEHLTSYKAQLVQQQIEVDKLKANLCTLNGRFEDAKRARSQISARDATTQELRWVDQVALFFEGLAMLNKPGEHKDNEEHR